MVSTFFVLSPIFALSFFEVSGFTVESTLVVELESTWLESELLLELLPLHAAMLNDIAKAINGSLM